MNVVGQFTCDRLGAVETKPGLLFYRLIKPTDFDFAYDNMLVRIRDGYDKETAWRLLGWFGGPLKTWLTRYIYLSSKYGDSYTPQTPHTWMMRFLNEYPKDYQAVDLKVYFDVLYSLFQEKQVGRNIYAPYTYVPEKPDPKKLIFKYAVFSAALLIAATATYTFIRYRRK